METLLIINYVVDAILIITAIGFAIRFWVIRKRKPRGFSKETEINIDRLIREKEKEN